MGKENSFESPSNGIGVGNIMSIFDFFRIVLGCLILTMLWCQV
jgi:hypothetical protein